MSKKDETSTKCEICGKAGNLFVVLGQKNGSNNVDFYWVCRHCHKTILWVFERMDEANANANVKAKRENNR